MSQSSVRSAVPNGLTAFAPDEVAELELYHELTGDLDSYELASRQAMTFEIDADGDLTSGPDRQQLEALFTAFRKIGWLEDDRGTFAKVRNLLGRHASAAGTPEAAVLLDVLKKLKRFRTQALRSSSIMGYALEHPDGTVEKVTPKDAINILVNGVIFHNDPELRTRWKQLGGLTNPAISMMVVPTLQELVVVFRLLDQIVAEVLATPSLHMP